MSIVRVNFRTPTGAYKLGELEDDTEIAMLSPGNTTYDKRDVVFTYDKSEMLRLLKEGWDAMLARHYRERLALETFTPTDYSRYRGITDHVYHD
jgi:hypothetical protein